MGGNLERPVDLVKWPSYQLLAGKIGRQWQNCNVHLRGRYTVRCNRADIAVSVSWYNDIEP